MLQTLKDWDLYAQRQVQFLQIRDIAKALQQAQQKENPYNLNAIKKINSSDTAEFAKINLWRLCSHLYLTLKDFLFYWDDCIQNTIKSHYLILKT